MVRFDIVGNTLQQRVPFSVMKGQCFRPGLEYLQELRIGSTYNVVVKFHHLGRQVVSLAKEVYKRDSNLTFG